ncbi:unnamed protein product [Arabis nemorensis]|uniref:NAD-dependent epimerase/dehydratase domain-containing protein n=1 Tax=Arabis nemorensis TaxID=586526 RepID=A0A565C3T5_9BRAS|nr:unnamed protein product [Arabis nemorensis]
MKKVNELLPEFADAEEKELYEFLDLQLQSDLNEERSKFFFFKPFLFTLSVATRRNVRTLYLEADSLVRDYIHVVDLADGHISALRKLDDSEIGCEVYNLGTGKGTTVLEMVDAFEKASGMKIPLVKVGRSPGDA